MDELTSMIVSAHMNEKKVLICGNGGLAAESDHFAAELMGKYGANVYVPCIALTTSTALITAIANDIGYDAVFSHQIGVLSKPGDILIAMTGGNPRIYGHSANILRAIDRGHQCNLRTVLICGLNFSPLRSVTPAQLVKRMESKDGVEIQNLIIRYLHAVAFDVKQEIERLSNRPSP